MNILYTIFASIIYTTCHAFKRQNVLLIVVDDLRPALGIYNDPNAFTPNIDSLATKSFVFNNTFAQQALCAPSRNSFLTSRRPDSLHLYDFYNYWRDTVGNYTTLPQHFKEHGYFTYAIGKVFHPGISSNYSDDSPYSWSKKPFHPSTLKYKNNPVCLNKKGKWGSNLLCPVRVVDQPEKNLPDIQSLQEMLRFINSCPKEPYFLAVGLHKPHIPLKFPHAYLGLHPLNSTILPVNMNPPSDLPSVAWNPWVDVKLRDDVAALNISFPFGTMPKAFNAKIVQHYAAATSYMDDLVGTMLNHIDNNTIVVLIGDHGVSMGEHGEFSKYSNFDIATRVPFIIHVPGMTEETIISNNLVELVDLFPTLVDLTQVSEALEVCSYNGSNSKLCTEGKSLVPHMVDIMNKAINPIKTKLAAFTQYPRPSNYPKENSDKPKLKDIRIMGYSIRTEEFRYTEWVKFDNVKCRPDWTHVYNRELYYHIIDADENMNLATRPEMMDIMKRLRKRLIAGWRYA